MQALAVLQGKDLDLTTALAAQRSELLRAHATVKAETKALQDAREALRKANGVN